MGNDVIKIHLFSEFFKRWTKSWPNWHYFSFPGKFMNTNVLIIWNLFMRYLRVISRSLVFILFKLHLLFLTTRRFLLFTTKYNFFTLSKLFLQSFLSIVLLFSLITLPSQMIHSYINQWFIFSVLFKLHKILSF